MAALSPEENVPSEEVSSFEIIDKKRSPKEASNTEKAVQPGKKILETRVKGKVLWFSTTRKYGFITRSDPGMEGYDEMDIFVHVSGIASNKANKRFVSLSEGQEVLFDVQEGGKCGSAINVTGLDGKPVKKPRRRQDAQIYQVKKESDDADHKIPRKKYGAAKKNSDEKVKEDSMNDVTSALTVVSIRGHQLEQEAIVPK